MNKSIWEDQMLQDQESKSNSNFYFNIKENEEMILKWLDISWQDQRENTPENFKTPDGRELLLKFEFPDGTEHGFTAKSNKNKLIRAMKEAGVELGDVFKVVRHGMQVDNTTYAVTLMRDGVEEIITTEKSETPF